MDPSLPAIRRWLFRAIGQVAAVLITFLIASWTASRIILPAAVPFRFLLGILTVVVALTLIHVAGRMVNAWIRRLARGTIALIVGQVMGTLLLAVLSAALGGALYALGPQSHTMSRWAFVFTGAFVLWLGVLLIYGRTPGRHLPRGVSLRRALGPGPFDDRRKARAAIAAANARGIRPRDVDPATIAHSLLIADGTPPDIEDQMYAYYASLDRGDVDSAGAILRTMEARTEKHSRRMAATLVSESASFLARYQHDPGAAREVLQRYRDAPHDPQPFRLTAAAIFLAEGRRQAALGLLEDLREPVTRGCSRTGIDAFLYDRWALMLAESAMPPSHLHPWT